MLKHLTLVFACVASLSLSDRALAQNVCSSAHQCRAGTRVVAAGSFNEYDTPICTTVGAVGKTHGLVTEEESCPPPGYGGNKCETQARHNFAKLGCYEETNHRRVYWVVSSKMTAQGRKYLRVSPNDDRAKAYWAAALQFHSVK